MEHNIEADFPDPVNTVINSGLRAAIRAMLYSENKRNLDGFLRVFLQSDLIVLTLNAPEPPESDILQLDEEGFGYYQPGTNIPLLQLNTDEGRMILPVFTESCLVHCIAGLEDYHGLLLSVPLILEMAVEAGTDSFCINPGSEEEFSIERVSIIELVSQLKENGILAQDPSVAKR
jgi:hypothetical protein